jgi:hypothetical protein
MDPYTNAGVLFSASAVLSGPGTYTETFDLSGNFEGFPAGMSAGPGCNNCTNFTFNGGGTVTLEAVPYPPISGTLEIAKATYTVKAPEPSTTALLLSALGGLAIADARRRRQSRPRTPSNFSGSSIVAVSATPAP